MMTHWIRDHGGVTLFVGYLLLLVLGGVCGWFCGSIDCARIMGEEVSASVVWGLCTVVGLMLLLALGLVWLFLVEVWG
ncbi:MAG: hypothetical protein ACYTEQ_30295 [Planctomycetota bacterium]|jgi:hypothetical protein